jgi:CRISPR-associated protein Csm3
MRSQTEKLKGLRQNKDIGQVKIHSCKSDGEYQTCPVCAIFGVPADEIKNSLPARLIVRDVLMSDESLKEFERMKVKSFAEIKTEVAIDRVTSAASPRSLERVPAGAEFGPAEFVFGIYEHADFNRLKTVIEALQLVEDDYLGGAGSRGSGKVQFENIEVYARSGDAYGTPIPLGKYEKVQYLLNDFEKIKSELAQNIKAG